MTQKVLIGGNWQDAKSGTFTAFNPTTTEALPEQFPISKWDDCDAALDAAAAAFRELRETPVEKIAEFLEAFADNIEANSEHCLLYTSPSPRDRG